MVRYQSQRAPETALLGRPELAGEQGWPAPDVIGILGQHMPDYHRKLPRGGDGRNMLATTCCNPLVEGT